jgi:adenosylmethionine-8-amino-7-oxononanoate aminotransferase
MGHTYAQNPVTAAAGLAVLEYIQRHDLVHAAEERGAQLLSGLQSLIGRHRILGDARGLGLLLGVELVRDRVTREPFAVEDGVAFRFGRACIDAGAAVYPGQSGADGLVGDHALVTPPLVITPDQVDDLIGAIDRGLTRLEAELSISG